MSMLSALYEKAAEYAGREVSVEPTNDGKHIVLFMVLGKDPPPKGNSEEDALMKFIDWAKDMPAHLSSLPEVDLHSDEEDHRPAPRDTLSEY